MLHMESFCRNNWMWRPTWRMGKWAGYALYPPTWQSLWGDGTDNRKTHFLLNTIFIQSFKRQSDIPLLFLSRTALIPFLPSVEFFTMPLCQALIFSTLTEPCLSHRCVFCSTYWEQPVTCCILGLKCNVIVCLSLKTGLCAIYNSTMAPCLLMVTICFLGCRDRHLKPSLLLILISLSC